MDEIRAFGACVAIVLVALMAWSLWLHMKLRKKIGLYHIMMIRFDADGGYGRQVWAAICVRRRWLLPDKCIVAHNGRTAEHALEKLTADDLCVEKMPRVKEASNG